MIEVAITPEMMEIAKKKAKELGVLKNSITGGEGNLAGILGEVVVHTILGGEWKNTRDYDVVFGDVKSDVKTKRCSSAPEPRFECSITAFNPTQKCDEYIFVRVLNDYSKAWILGRIGKEEYFKKARFIQQGQFDPSNNWRAKCDCYNVRIDELSEVIAA